MKVENGTIFCLLMMIVAIDTRHMCRRLLTGLLNVTRIFQYFNKQRATRTTEIYHYNFTSRLCELLLNVDWMCSCAHFVREDIIL